MPSPIRRSDVDACPGALRLHAAADGLLARVRLPGGMLTGAQLATLGELADTFGDGTLELTSRANLQLRGLRSADAAALAARLTAAGLLPSATHELVRNIAAAPLAGPAVRGLVRDLDQALCADAPLAALPGKFLFAIGATSLVADVAAIPADGAVPVPTLRPAPDGRFRIFLAGAPTELHLTADDVVPTLLAAAHAFLAERAATGTTPWRLSELPDGPARVATHLATRCTGGSSVEPPEDLVGVLAQDPEAGVMAVGALVPLGRLTGVHRAVLRRARRLTITPARGVVVGDLTAAAARQWAGELAEAGLAVRADSRWTGVTACAGRPGCARALADVRADADATTRFVDGLPVHWVGCERGCGSPTGPHVRVEATADAYVVSHPATDAGQRVTRDAGLADVVAAARADTDRRKDN